MYNIDLANVKSIVADIVAKHNVENVAFVGCGASKAELYPRKVLPGKLQQEAACGTLHRQRVQLRYPPIGWATPPWSSPLLWAAAPLRPSRPTAWQRLPVQPLSALPTLPVLPLTKEADYTIVHGFEANYAAKLEKMGYVLALAVEILQQVEGFDKYDKMIEGPDQRVRGCRERCQLCPQVCQGVR